MTFACWLTARFVIALPEAALSWSSRITFAPLARHCCACDFCFCASPSAFRTCAETPAFLNAAFRYGASNSVYRVDDFVSGSSAQALIEAVLADLWVSRADAAAATSPTRTDAVRTASAQRDTCLKEVPSYRG